MEKSVFVLSAHRDHESYSSSTDIIGVYDTHEKAEAVMKAEMEKELKNEDAFGDYEQEDLEVKYGSNTCSIFDMVGGLEYTEFSIYEREVE